MGSFWEDSWDTIKDTATNPISWVGGATGASVVGTANAASHIDALHGLFGGSSVDPALGNNIYDDMNYWKGMRSQYGDSLKQYLDPNLYQAQANRFAGEAQNRAQSRFSQIGLGGSSMAMGAGNSAYNDVLMQYKNRQLGDQQRALGMMSSIGQNIRGDNSQLIQLQLGAQQANANSQGQILGMIGTGLGAYFGGPGGAAVGNKLGSSMGGSSGYNPQSFDWNGDNTAGFNDPNLGDSMGYGASNPSLW